MLQCAALLDSSHKKQHAVRLSITPLSGLLVVEEVEGGEKKGLDQQGWRNELG